MQKRDVLEIGLKLLGVYFVVNAIAGLAAAGAVLYSAVVRGGLGQGQSILGMLPWLLDGPLRSTVFLFAAYMLLWQTRLCLRWMWSSLPEEQ